MASITIRNLDEEAKYRLRLRAALNGHSMEQEAREILYVVLLDSPSAQRIFGNVQTNASFDFPANRDNP